MTTVTRPPYGTPMTDMTDDQRTEVMIDRTRMLIIRAVAMEAEREMQERLALDRAETMKLEAPVDVRRSVPRRTKHGYKRIRGR